MDFSSHNINNQWSKQLLEDMHDDYRIMKKIEGYTCKSCTELLQASEGGMEGEEYNSAGLGISTCIMHSQISMV